jgi:prepilin-type N-terminal cleavage/methylation domain-containing protein
MTLKYDGFTLVEITIVIAIISILFTISLLPYGYYIERANLEKTSDMIGQEWIL